MKERPILFSAPMVRALLAGRKMQTRRIVKLPSWVAADANDGESAAERNSMTRVAWMPGHESGPGFYGWMTEYPEEGSVPIRCPYGQPGDRLWVRESFSGPHCMDESPKAPPSKWGRGSRIWFWADGDPDSVDWTKPRPSIHMPRWASRITLEITGVRVERLQAISEEDAAAEGCDGNCPIGHLPAYLKGPLSYHYAQLWESINGPDSWDANPWVWVIEFRRASP